MGGPKRWLDPRQAPLALDALDHRRFFTADIGAGAAPEMDANARQQAGVIELAGLVVVPVLEDEARVVE